MVINTCLWILVVCRGLCGTTSGKSMSEQVFIEKNGSRTTWLFDVGARSLLSLWGRWWLSPLYKCSVNLTNLIYSIHRLSLHNNGYKTCIMITIVVGLCLHYNNGYKWNNVECKCICNSFYLSIYLFMKVSHGSNTKCKNDGKGTI